MKTRIDNYIDKVTWTKVYGVGVNMEDGRGWSILTNQGTIFTTPDRQVAQDKRKELVIENRKRKNADK